MATEDIKLTIKTCHHGVASCEDCITEHSTLSGAIGRAGGIGWAISRIRTEAGEAFNMGDEDRARLLRRLAIDLALEQATAEHEADKVRREMGIW